MVWAPAKLLFCATLLGFALGLGSCTSSNVKDEGEPNVARGAGEWRNGKVGVVYNNDVFGYVEPCGCRVDPIGGVYRRWNATQAIPAANRLSVDAGNLFFGNFDPHPSVQNNWREQANGMVAAYNELGWDALQPGEFDFALGLDFLRALEQRAKFKFLSANIYERASGKRAFAPNAIFERGGAKVGVFGIFGDKLALPPTLEARDPVAAAREQAQELRAAGAQLIIALSHQGLDADEALAKAVPDIDLIAGASTQSFLQEPRKEGKTTIVQLSAKGQVFGLATYEARGGAASLAASSVTDLDARFDVNPGDGVNPMKPIIARMNLAIAEANRKASAEVWKEHDSRQAKFATHLSCTGCHAAQAKFQAAHPHSAAFFTLTARAKENSLDCLSCHSVGMGAPGGFEAASEAIRGGFNAPIDYRAVLRSAGLDKLPADNSYRGNGKKAAADAAKWERGLAAMNAKHSFVNVQCENCHGARPGHPFDETPPDLRKVKAVTCLQCHTAEQTPKWYGKGGKPLIAVLNAEIKKISCPRK